MRPLNFRTWHEDSKTMLAGPLEYWFEACRQTRVSPFSKVTPWMQFTGLLDVNGVEIWEGDVIQGKIIPEPSVGTMGVVEYSAEDCCFGNKNDGGFTHLNLIGNILVLGNIYEDPELLN